MGTHFFLIQPFSSIQSYLNHFFRLTKGGIVFFVLITGFSGFFMGLPLGRSPEIESFLLFFLGLYFSCSGSFALNQAQEIRLDQKMLRTQKRPLVSGRMSLWQAYVLGVIFCFLGLFFLSLLSGLSFFLALLTLIFYNGFYTLIWKKKWMFGAVPGALPGALPVLIGYSVHRSDIFSMESMYLFFILFLWQMPHFWSLALLYKEDYKKGEIPVLPLSVGTSRTLYHMGLYIFSYVGLVLAAPFFLRVSVFYFFLALPLVLKVFYEFWKYFKANGSQKSWSPFFLWVNVSVIGFLWFPVVDKWISSFL